MARRRKEEGTKSAFGPLVEVVGLGGAELFVYEPTHSIWTQDEPSPVPYVIGGYCWLQPPPSATDAKIAKVKRRLEELGAAAVKVERQQGADVVTAGAVKTAEAGVEQAVAPSMSFREVIEQLLDDVLTKDREGLCAAIEQVLSEEGV